jgi:ATP-dependent RNA helicase DHX8/PRP22
MHPSTVEGVVYVIDSGVVKQKHYHPDSGMDSLDVVPISRVQATQRAGRAGRTRPGKVRRRATVALKPFSRHQWHLHVLPYTTALPHRTSSLHLSVSVPSSTPRPTHTRTAQCFRLYTRTYFESQMPDASLPEIQRSSLAGAVLHLKALRLPLDVLAFDFLDAPAK